MKVVLCFILFILISVPAVVQSDDADCVYTVYVKTGSIIGAGTDSIISLILYDANGYGIWIRNLEAWGGLMGANYDYFELGNLDIFSGRGPCLTGPVCMMNLTSDRSGLFPAWNCDYVDVTTTGVSQTCAQQLFRVDQWFSTFFYPFQLTAVRDYCNWDGDNVKIREPHVIDGSGSLASKGDRVKMRKSLVIDGSGSLASDSDQVKKREPHVIDGSGSLASDSDQVKKREPHVIDGSGSLASVV